MKRKDTMIPLDIKEEATEETVVTEEIAEEEKEEKEMGFLKKHWKKLAIGGGILLAGVGGFLLGSKDSDNEGTDISEIDDPELLEMIDSAPFDQDNSDEKKDD